MRQIKAIIPAAGYATRMYPLTWNYPKHLLEINGRPIIEHVIVKILELKDVDEIFIVSNEKYYPPFEEWLKKFRCSIPVRLLNDKTVSNEDRLGQVGDILFVIEKAKIDDDLLVVAGDNVFNFSLRDAYLTFRTKNTVINALYDPKSIDIAREQGVGIVDENNKFIDFQEKDKNPKATTISLGIYFFKKEDVRLLRDYVDEGNNADKMGYFMTWLINKRDVYGHVYLEKWFDIGWLEALEQARKEFKPRKFHG